MGKEQKEQLRLINTDVAEELLKLVVKSRIIPDYRATSVVFEERYRKSDSVKIDFAVSLSELKGISWDEDDDPFAYHLHIPKGFNVKYPIF